MIDLPVIQLNHDELEALKLCDMEDLTQEQAAIIEQAALIITEK